MLASFRAQEVAVLLPGLVLALALMLHWGRWSRLLAAGMLLAGVAWHTLALSLPWQMAPAYAASVLLLVLLLRLERPAALRRARRPAPDSLKARVGLIAASALLLLVSCASLLVLPIFELPLPTGPFPVGTRILHVLDPERRDTSFPSGRRELMIQVWYPAGPSVRGERLAPYRRWPETTLLSSYQAMLPTHSRLNAPLAAPVAAPPAVAAPYPVLLFNPAWAGMRTQNTFLTEDLASHGFVVAAVDHTYNSMLVAFPGGRVVQPANGPAVDDFSHRSMEEVLAYANAELATEAADDRLVLDYLAAEAARAGSPWFRMLDTTHAGALGHSFGGAVAVQACAEDGRIRAALNMDGWMFGALDHPLGKPLFLIYDGDWPFNPAVIAQERKSTETGERLDIRDLQAAERSMQQSGGYFLAIEQIRHMNFTDRALYSPWRRLTDTGARDGAEVQRILRAYALAFFMQELRGAPSPLLSGATRYPGAYLRGESRPAH